VILTSLTNDRFSLFVNNDETSEIIVEYAESFELAYNAKNNLVCFVSDHSGVLEYFEILDSMQLLLYADEEAVLLCDVNFTRFEERDEIICSAIEMKNFPDTLRKKNKLYQERLTL